MNVSIGEGFSSKKQKAHITVGNFNLHFTDQGDGNWKLDVNAAERGTQCTLFHVVGGSDNKDCLCVTATAYNDNRIAKRQAGEENPEIDRTTIAATAPHPPEAIWRQQQAQLQAERRVVLCEPLLEQLRELLKDGPDLTPAKAVQMAEACVRLKKEGDMRLKDIAIALGVEYQLVRNWLQLLLLPPEKLEKMRQGQLTVKGALKWFRNHPNG